MCDLHIRAQVTSWVDIIFACSLINSLFFHAAFFPMNLVLLGLGQMGHDEALLSEVVFLLL
jgi:hypothetical protein